METYSENEAKISRTVISSNPEEIVEKTFNYLREIGVIDEDRLDAMQNGERMDGICIVCRNPGGVYTIGMSPDFGVCSRCFERARLQIQGRRHGGVSEFAEEIGDKLFNNDGMGIPGLGGAGFGAQGAFGAGGAGFGVPGAPGAAGQAAAVAAAKQMAEAVNAGQMVLNAQGQLVPANPPPPGSSYGYMKDPVTGQFVPAPSPDAAKAAALQVANQNLAVAQQAAAATGTAVAGGTAAGAAGQAVAVAQQAVATINAGQMVLNKDGLLVPLSSLAGTAASSGYIIDSSGRLVPAPSLEAAKTAALGKANDLLNKAQQAVKQPTLFGNVANLAANLLGSGLFSSKKDSTPPASGAKPGTGTPPASGANPGTGTPTASGANPGTGTPPLDLASLPKAEREKIENLRRRYDDLADKMTKALNDLNSAKVKLEGKQKDLKEEKDNAANKKGRDLNKAKSKIAGLEKLVQSALDEQTKLSKTLQDAQTAADAAKKDFETAEAAAVQK
jgi:hypothetical protein